MNAKMALPAGAQHGQRRNDGHKNTSEQIATS
jgi:hypothetical protein